MTLKCKIKKGDTVVVTTGQDTGKVGKVLKVFPAESKLIVEGVRLMTHFQKESAGGQQKKEAKIHVSNVSYFSESIGKGSKIGLKIENGEKVRFLKRTLEVI